MVALIEAKKSLSDVSHLDSKCGSCVVTSCRIGYLCQLSVVSMSMHISEDSLCLMPVAKVSKRK